MENGPIKMLKPENNGQIIFCHGYIYYLCSRGSSDDDNLIFLYDKKGGTMTIYNLIIGITIYMMIKIVLWWLVFGTARVVAGKYSGKVWRNYTGWGLLIMLGVILMDVFMTVG